MKYRKIPVEIEAIQWNGNNIQEIVNFVGDACTIDMLPYSNIDRPIYTVIIRTLEGTMRAGIGDYIIRGAQGEFYPCKPDMFEQNYEVVE